MDATSSSEPQESSDGEDLTLDFPPEVLKAIQEILPSDDPFDSSDFNAVDYINEMFPNEQSLHRIDDVLDQMSFKIMSIDDEIRSVVRSLTNVEQDGQTSLSHAHEAINELFTRFDNIKEKAAESEEKVKEITRDIKQLDISKKNLTTSITTLNHLQMLVEGVDKLSTLKIEREYGEIATLLQGVNNVLDHLAKYRHIPQVSDLAGQVEQIQKDLEKQILDDFKDIASSRSKRFAPSRKLAEACLVVSVLDKKVKKTILDDVIKCQLAEYEVLFACGEVDGGLNKVELRRKWFMKTAIEFEKTLAAMFPPNWEVPALLAYNFCTLTCSQLEQTMHRSRNDIDAAAIIQAQKILSELELLLSKKYTNFTTSKLLDQSKTETDNSESVTKSNNNEINTSPFLGAICKCFVPFLSIYLNSIDKKLNENIDKFAIQMKSYQFEMLEAEASNVVPFCGQLFTIYKNVLVEFLRVSSGSNIFELAELFQKHLKEFAVKILRASLPRLGANIPIPKDLNMKELSTAVFAQVQTLWRDGDSPKLTENDIRKVCAVLVSSEYCEEMTSRLEDKLKEKASSGLKDSSKTFSLVSQQYSTSTTNQQASKTTSSNKRLSGFSDRTNSLKPISFASEVDLFHDILNECIILLVSHVETQCDASLSSMPKMNWTLDMTGDQSSYISNISSVISSNVPTIRHNLHSSRKYFTRFCDKLASNLINKFIHQIYKCRPLNAVGCEQLLLDTHSLKAIILNLPIVSSQAQRNPPQAYTRIVSKMMNRAELLLQVVMSENSNEEFVEKFLRLLPETSLTDFQKVLELRGVRDKAPLLELYQKKVILEASNSMSNGASDLTQNFDDFENSTNSQVVGSPQREVSKIARLERLLKSRRLIT